jgi:hypothetical protein
MSNPNKKEPTLAELVDASFQAQREAEEAHNEAFGAKWPYRLLEDVGWSFGPDTVGLSRAEVEAKVRQTHAAWQPEKVVLRASRALVLYPADRLASREPAAGARYHLAELCSEDGENFTEGELFYKLYQAAAPVLRDSLHRHLEYLRWMGVVAFIDSDRVDGGAIVCYQMYLND